MKCSAFGCNKEATDMFRGKPLCKEHYRKVNRSFKRLLSVIILAWRGREMDRPIFPCAGCVEAWRCRKGFLYVDCAALNAYKEACRRRRLRVRRDWFER